MNINDQFPSKYLKASDLQGRSISVKIREVVSETIGQDQRTVMYFVGKQKGMVVNRTNGMTIAEIWGPETDAWIGGELEIFSMKVPYQGKLTDGLRVRVPTKRPAQRAPAPQAMTDYREAAQIVDRPPPQKEYEEILDDEIPF